MPSISPTDDEVVAALAAIRMVLSAAAPSPQSTPPSGWQASVKASQQGCPPVKTPVVPRWGTIERLRRL